MRRSGGRCSPLPTSVGRTLGIGRGTASRLRGVGYLTNKGVWLDEESCLSSPCKDHEAILLS